MRLHRSRASLLLSPFLAVGVVALSPVAWAQEAAPPPPPGTTQGAGQGSGQGTNQGATQGGPSLASLGVIPDENGVVDTSVLGDSDPRQGAQQGAGQGTTNGTAATAANANTGASSTNTATTTATSAAAASTANTSATTNAAAGAATTGQNAADENTGNASVTTGNAGVGVQQVVADNLVTTGSVGAVAHTSTPGGQSGDVVLDFAPQSGSPLGGSFQSTNTVTGAGATNTAQVTSTTTTLTEVQNDGTITNTLSAAAITGQNSATQNTGNASVTTGDADVAVALLNFLNVNVLDGFLWLDVVDIFGDLAGNIIIPEEAIAYLERRQRELLVSATNDTTGADSTNTLDVDVTSTEETSLTNTAAVSNAVNVNAVTGQNTATQNTGGSAITTGNVQATANTVTLANLNVVDGNLGLIIVNALNRWLGFLLGSDGTWTPIDHDFSTLVSVGNSTTGSGSTNTASVAVTDETTTTVTNDAVVTNALDLTAITGQNTVNQNTGNAAIATGNARVNATVVNVVNTNVVRGGFFAAVVNVFGNWLGELFFGSQPLGTLASSGTGVAGGLQVQATNANTGPNSVNTVGVDVTHASALTVENTADIENVLVVNADTGHNKADRNTGLGSVDTGDVLAVLHARNIANVTLAGLGSGFSDITADLLNATTGASSTNTIDVTVNDTREVTVLNDAQVDTAIGAVANTGFNTANRNTLGGLIQTGSARLETFVENLLNQTFLAGSPAGSAPPLGASLALGLTNTETGAASTNTLTADADIAATVDVTNSALVDTDVAAVATTGNNQANENTGGGAVASGSAGIGGGIDNTANHTAVVGTVPGSLDLGTENAADIRNTFAALASTGGNEVNRNTGALTLPPAAAGGAPPPSGGGETAGPAPVAGIGGGPPGAFGGGAELRGDGGAEQVRVPTAQKRVAKKPARKPQVKAAARPPRPPVAGGELGGGPAWEPIVRSALRVPTAQAAAGQGADSPPAAPQVLPSPNVAARNLWPWAFLAASLALGLLPIRRVRGFLGSLRQKS